MSDIRRSKTMPGSLAAARRGPPPRSATKPVARDDSEAGSADPFNVRQFFHDQPAGHWPWVMEDSDVETEADSEDGARTPISIAGGRLGRGAVFDFSQVYALGADGASDGGREGDSKGAGRDEATILEEDKLGVVRLTSGDLDFASFAEPWSALKGPGLDASHAVAPSRAASPMLAFPSADGVLLEQPEDLEWVHRSMCARREANTRRLIGAEGPPIPPGGLFLESATQADKAERPLLARLLDALYAWL
ncbi:hypothetical protein AURDEDRAFT_155865 [Auricularia subglabra TFB-10046 SS5]|nr:hypothetical protein AURDEDRAFT_155865 [Auricularia subglabra TFB-10046 SS5]